MGYFEPRFIFFGSARSFSVRVEIFNAASAWLGLYTWELGKTQEPFLKKVDRQKHVGKYLCREILQKILQKHAYEILHKHVAGSVVFLYVFLLFFDQQI